MKQEHRRAVWAAIPVCLAARLAVPALGQPCGLGWVLKSSVGPVGGAMAYDPIRGRVMAFNGQTWEWDGVGWTVRATSGPSARYAAAMAFDGARVILFGGSIGATYPGDTWAWDGAAGVWTQLAPSTSPAPRFGHDMVYDPIRDAIVLFGGVRNGTSCGSDTWEWRRLNGTWAQQFIAGPTACAPVGVFDDAQEQVTIFVSGSWARKSNVPGPWVFLPSAFGPNNAAGMAIDTSRNVAVLVDYNQGTYYGLTTWEHPANAPWALRCTATPGSYPSSVVYDRARSRTVLLSGQQTWEWDGLSGGPAILATPSFAYVLPGGSVTIAISASGPGLSFQWRRGLQNLEDTGPYSGVHTASMTVGPATPGLADVYSVVVSNACGSVTTMQISLRVTCWANCDGSSASPVLNANDFQCFINAFASGSSEYANCDGSVAPPVLNANDFNCFLNKYAANDCN